jgi:hypothetical protein
MSILAGIRQALSRSTIAPISTLTSPFFSQLRNTQGIGLMAGAYGVFKASSAIGDELDTANRRAGRGTMYGTMVKGAGMIAGGVMGISGATKMVSQQARILGNTFNSERRRVLEGLNAQQKYLDDMVDLRKNIDLKRSESLRFKPGSTERNALVAEARTLRNDLAIREKLVKDRLKMFDMDESMMPTRKELNAMNTGKEGLSYRKMSPEVAARITGKDDPKRAEHLFDTDFEGVDINAAKKSEIDDFMAESRKRKLQALKERRELKRRMDPKLKSTQKKIDDLEKLVASGKATSDDVASLERAKDLNRKRLEASKKVDLRTRGRIKGHTVEEDIFVKKQPDRFKPFTKNNNPFDRYDSAAKKISRFPGMLLGMAGTVAADTAVGVAAAPLAPLALIGRGFANSNYAGSAILGLGLYGGLGAAAISSRVGDFNPQNRAALGGTAVYDPNSPGRPRRSGIDPSLNNTAGLVQSLHKMR